MTDEQNAMFVATLVSLECVQRVLLSLQETVSSLIETVRGQQEIDELILGRLADLEDDRDNPFDGDPGPEPGGPVNRVAALVN